MKKWMVNVLAVVAVMAVASSVWATPLVPPQEVFNPTATTGVAPWGSSMTLLANTTSSYAAGSLSGTLTSQVYREAGGTLDFFYQVTSTSSHPALHISVPGFGSATTNVYFVTDPTILPSAAASSLGTVGYSDFYRIDPDVVGGDWGPTGLANATSYWLVVQTNATSYGSTTALIQDGAQASAASFAPAPLPSSLALFATGAVSLVGGFVRRFRRNPM